MLLAGFGETFSEARASSLQQLPFHPRDLTEEERAGANITAIVLHGSVYSVRSDVACVLHTHSPYATAMAAADVDFDAEIIQVRNCMQTPCQDICTVLCCIGTSATLVTL